MNDLQQQVCQDSSNSSVRRNYLPLSHRCRDGLIEFIQDMLMHSFVLNSPESYFRKPSLLIIINACCVLCFFF